VRGFPAHHANTGAVGFFAFTPERGAEMAEETQGEMPNNDQGDEIEPNEQQASGEGVTLDQLQAELEETRKALSKANRESAQRRKKLEEFESKEQERAEAELSEMEKLQKQIDLLNAEKEQAQKHAQEILIKSAVISQAAALNFNDPEDAFALVDKSQFEVEDGKVAGVEEALKELAKSKPYMLQTQRKPQALITNPGENVTGQGDTDAQRRARLYGAQSPGLFTPEGAKKHGGGVAEFEQ